VPQSCYRTLNLDGASAAAFGAKREKEVVARELEARGVAVKRAKGGKPTDTLVALIARLKACDGGVSTIRRRVDDYESVHHAPAWKKPRRE